MSGSEELLEFVPVCKHSETNEIFNLVSDAKGTASGFNILGRCVSNVGNKRAGEHEHRPQSHRFLIDNN